LKCQLNNGSTVNAGATIPASDKKSADVVFVVESNECNANAAKTVDTLAKAISQKMNQKGIHDTKFALVSYGPEGKVRVHSNAGQFLTSEPSALFANFRGQQQ